MHQYFFSPPVRGYMNEQSGKRLQTEFIVEFTEPTCTRVCVCVFTREGDG